MADSDIRILGVKHSDDSIHEPIEEEAASVAGPDIVFHEWPESNPDFWNYAYWTLLKNPVVIVPAFLHLVRAMVRMRRGITVTSTGSVELETECKRAAKQIRDEYDSNLVYIGMNRAELLKERKWTSALHSWGIFLFIIGSIWMSVVNGELAFLWFLLFPVVFSVAHRKRTLDQVRDLRDKHMARSILDYTQEHRPESAFVIVGEKHVKGIGAQLGARDIFPVCRWLTSESDFR